MGDKKGLVRLSDSLIQGTKYEHLWVADVLDRNIIPAKPEVPVPWDYIATRLSDLKSLKIQIKGTKTALPMFGNKQRFQVTAKSGYKGATCVDPDVIDILACYVEPYRCWYNIPMKSLASKAVWLYPNNNDSNGQYEIWRCDWSAYAA